MEAFTAPRLIPLASRRSCRSRRRPDWPASCSHTRSATSVNTRRLLLEHGGFLYDSNAYDVDAPRLERHEGRPDVIMPYAFDTDDMRFFNNGGFVFPEDFSRDCNSPRDCLLAEAAAVPPMLSTGLHLRSIGRPGRIAGLEQALRHASTCPDAGDEC